MNHHRCTRCKRESYPRHKYRGGVFCEDCMIEIGAKVRRRGFFGRIWDSVTDVACSLFGAERSKAAEARAVERQVRARYRHIQKVARSIPRDPQAETA